MNQLSLSKPYMLLKILHELQKQGVQSERLRVISSLASSPGLKNIGEIMTKECTIGPSEAIYVPDSWWHSTLSLGESVSYSTFLFGVNQRGIADLEGDST